MGKKKNNKNKDIKKVTETQGIEFPRDSSIGAPDAIDDSLYLEKCFIETDLYNDIVKPTNKLSLLIGRTGTGKTAYMQNIKKVSANNKHNMRCTEIDVDGEFLGHFEELRSVMGKEEQTHMLLFLKALWMHILVVHLARVLFPSHSDFLSTIKRLASKNSPENKLRKYIEKHEDAVWDGGSSAQIVKKVISSRDVHIEPHVALGTASVGLGHITSSKKVIEVQKENKKNSQGLSSILNFPQLKIFAKVICDHVADEKITCYVLIDKLDTEWASDSVRYTLIRVLTETIRDFYKVEGTKRSSSDPYPVKIIVALRRDLLDKVSLEAKTVGFQSEKLSPFECNIKWSKRDLRRLVNERICYLMERSGIMGIGFDKIFPPTMTGHGSVRNAQDTFNYIEERTLQRPRDIIEFVNSCFKQLVIKKRSVLTEAMIKHAEEEYSKNRFISVTEEWTSIHPKLDVYAKFLHEFRGNFKFSEFRGKVKEFLITEKCDDDCYEEWVARVEQDEREVAREMLNIFCKIGFVMVKLSTKKSYEIFSQGVSQGQCKPDLLIKIHPMFYAYFGVDDRNID